MAKKLLGKKVAAEIDDATDEMKNLCVRQPALGIIRVGDDPGAISYERSIANKCSALNIDCYKTYITGEAEDMDVIKAVADFNEADFVTGILLCCPLPPKFDQNLIESFISPAKDVDAVNGTTQLWNPCTAQACIEILEYYKVAIAWQCAVVIGRSNVVGRPVARMLLDRDATVTICHSKTLNLKEISHWADILISAAGKPGLITADFVRPGQTVIDVGMNTGADGKLCGDVDYAAVEPIVSAITPVPGGVGAVTTSVLLQNVVEAACNIR